MDLIAKWASTGVHYKIKRQLFRSLIIFYQSTNSRLFSFMLFAITVLRYRAPLWALAIQNERAKKPPFYLCQLPLRSLAVSVKSKIIWICKKYFKQCAELPLQSEMLSIHKYVYKFTNPLPCISQVHLSHHGKQFCANTKDEYVGHLGVIIWY